MVGPKSLFLAGIGLATIWVCAAVRGDDADGIKFKEESIHIYYDYNPDGFFEINGIELDPKAISVVYGNPKGARTGDFEFKLASLKNQIITRTKITEVVTIDRPDGKPH